MLRILSLIAAAVAACTVNAAELGVIDIIPFDHPRGLEISPDGSELYVQYGSDPQYIAVVDTATNSVLANIPFGGGYLIDISPDGTRLYAAAQYQLEVVDLVNRTALSPIPIPGAGTAQAGVAVSPDGNRVYVTNYGVATGLLYVIDATTDSYLGSIVADPYGWPFIMGIDIAPSGDFAYIASRKYGHVNIIDLGAQSRLETLPLGFGTSNILTNVRNTSDGTRAYVTNVQYSFISVVDTDPASPTFHQEIDWFDTGGSGLGRVSLSRDGFLGWVTDGPWGANKVVVFDADPLSADFHTVVDEVEVGNNPWDVLPFERGDQLAYVTVWDPQTEGGGYLAVVGYSEPVASLSCSGFMPPADKGPITVKKNRAIPFKAEIFDADNNPVTGEDIASPPVVQVIFVSDAGGDPVDVTDEALPPGASSEGNVFEFLNSHWHYNLKTSNFSAAGTYTVTMVSGDVQEYSVNPACEASFVIF